MVSLEVREAGSDELIEFGQLETPRKVSVTTPRTVDTTLDYFTGRGQVAAPVFWCWVEWTWGIEGTRSIGVKPCPAGRIVTAEASWFERWSVIVRMAGCDSIPQSTQVIDAYRVCDGDNTTCSGCDCVPSVGYD